MATITQRIAARTHFARSAVRIDAATVVAFAEGADLPEALHTLAERSTLAICVELTFIVVLVELGAGRAKILGVADGGPLLRRSVVIVVALGGIGAGAWAEVAGPIVW